MNRHPSPKNGSAAFAEARGDIAVSFEFFPPKTEKMAETLWESVQTLAPLQPRFVSVTYGAGGSTRERTHQTVERILKETSLTPAAHLTCVGASRERNRRGRSRILGPRRPPHRRAARRSARSRHQISAAPRRLSRRGRTGRGPQEGGAVRHFGRRLSRSPPDSRRRSFDIENLKRKVDAGADRAITQFFFSADCFFRFRDEAAAAGLDVEIVPGILPVSNVATTRRFAGHLRREHSRMAGRAVRRPRRPSVGASAHCGDRRRRAVRAALCGRRPPLPLLHFEPGGAVSYAICHLLGVRAQSMSASQTLRAEAAKRILIKDGPYGTGIQDEKLAGRRLLRRPRPDQGPEGQQRPSEHHPAAGRPLDLRALRRGRRRNPRDQHLQRQPHQPGRLCRRASGRRHQPRLGPHHPRGRRPLHGQGRPAALGRRSARPDEQDAVAIAGRQRSPPSAKSTSTR